MPDPQGQGGNSQTLCVELENLNYKVLEQDQGLATVIRFQLHNRTVKIGDVLVVLERSDIRFHGMIVQIDDQGWATAADRSGSTVPAALH